MLYLVTSHHYTESHILRNRLSAEMAVRDLLQDGHPERDIRVFNVESNIGFHAEAITVHKVHIPEA